MRIIILALLIVCTIINYYCAVQNNGNKSLNVIPTCSKPGNDSDSNDNETGDVDNDKNNELGNANDNNEMNNENAESKNMQGENSNNQEQLNENVHANDDAMYEGTPSSDNPPQENVDANNNEQEYGPPQEEPVSENNVENVEVATDDSGNDNINNNDNFNNNDNYNDNDNFNEEPPSDDGNKNEDELTEGNQSDDKPMNEEEATINEMGKITNPFEDMLKGKVDDMDIGKMMNKDNLQSFLSSLTGNKDGSGKNPLSDMMNIFGVPQTGKEGAEGGVNKENQMKQINELKDKLETMLKGAGVNVDKIKDSIKNNDLLKNKQLLKEAISKLTLDPSMMNMLNNKDGANGKPFDINPDSMMKMFNALSNENGNLDDLKMKPTDGSFDSFNDGVDNNLVPSNPKGQNNNEEDDEEGGDDDDYDDKSFVVNSKYADNSFEDKFNTFDEKDDDVKYELFGENEEAEELNNNTTTASSKGDANNSVNTQEGEGKEESFSANEENINNNNNHNNKNYNNYNTSQQEEDDNSFNENDEPLISSSQFDNNKKNKMSVSTHNKKSKNLMDSLDLESTNYGSNSSSSMSNNYNSKNKNSKKNNKKKSSQKDYIRTDGKVSFDMATLQKTIKNFGGADNEIVQNILKKYVTIDNDDDNDADEDEDEDDDDDDDLDEDEFSVKDIKKLIEEGILDYEDLTENELRKLAKPDDNFYELSPYASDEKDLSLNETSGLTNEQLKNFLGQNGTYHMSYDSKSIDYAKQKKSEKKEDQQEDDDGFYDAYKQIKNSYDGIPNNFNHEAPQLIGNNYVFTSIYDTKENLIKFLKKNSEYDLYDDDDKEGGNFKSPLYDKYGGKLQKFKRQRAFNILKQWRAKEKKLKEKKKKEEMEENKEFDFSKNYNFSSKNDGGVTMFSKDQLEDMVKNFGGKPSAHVTDSFSRKENPFVPTNTKNNSNDDDDMDNGYVTFDGKNKVSENDDDEKGNNNDDENDNDDSNDEEELDEEEDDN